MVRYWNIGNIAYWSIGDETMRTTENMIQEFRERFYLPNFPDGWSVQGTITELEQFIKEALERVREEILEYLLKNGHGGGNFRRLLEQLKANKPDTLMLCSQCNTMKKITRSGICGRCKPVAKDINVPTNPEEKRTYEQTIESIKKIQKLEAEVKECREIPGFSGYFVNERGDVFSNKHRIVGKRNNYVSGVLVKMSTPVEPRGYYYVSLWNKGIPKRIRVHKLVAMTFIPNKDNKPFVLHRDGNPANNNIENLYWGTAKENLADAKRHGTWWSTRPNPYKNLLDSCHCHYPDLGFVHITNGAEIHHCFIQSCEHCSRR